MSGAVLGSLDLARTSPLFRLVLRRVCALGFAVQGTLFAFVGVFLVQAAFDRDPGEATGPGGALHALASRPYGATLLLAAAVGRSAGIEGATKRLPAR